MWDCQHCHHDCKCCDLGLNLIQRQFRNLTKPFQPLLASAAQQVLQLWPRLLFTKYVLYRAARPPHLTEGHDVSALLTTVLDTEPDTWAGHVRNMPKEWGVGLQHYWWRRLLGRAELKGRDALLQHWELCSMAFLLWLWNERIQT